MGVHRGWAIIHSVLIDYDEQKERKVYGSYNIALLGIARSILRSRHLGISS